VNVSHSRVISLLFCLVFALLRALGLGRAINLHGFCPQGAERLGKTKGKGGQRDWLLIGLSDLNRHGWPLYFGNAQFLTGDYRS
jgi:hypothetical protein